MCYKFLPVTISNLLSVVLSFTLTARSLATLKLRQINNCRLVPQAIAEHKGMTLNYI
jgi:hypothetical protein